MGAIVADFRILKALERRGFVELNGSPHSRERHWTGARCRVITIRAGEALRNWWDTFTYNGVEYRIEYFDGCFKPFVVRVGVPRPSFV